LEETMESWGVYANLRGGNSQRIDADRIEVTAAGTLIFSNDDGKIVAVVSPAGYAYAKGPGYVEPGKEDSERRMLGTSS
jgi:hypothetical protein